MNRIDAESETLIACDVADTLTIGANQTTGFFGDVVASPLPIGFMWQSGQGGPSNALLTPNGGRGGIGCGAIANPQADGVAVRRLTPVECERLQGFPDNYTKIDAKTADGPRYRALGNSMAVPVMRWIGRRIQEAK